jgi:hypothetical protein
MLIEMNFMGFPFVADVEFSVTSHGSPAHMGSLSYPGDPGDPPEFDIESIVLYRDAPPPEHLCGITSPPFEATGALFDCLANLDLILEAIVDAIASDGPSSFDDDYC